jgi:hypothetical protein
MIDSGITSGERLCNFLNHRLLAGGAWNDLELLLNATGRSSQLVVFFRQVAAVTLTGRIVAAGVSISGADSIYDVAFQNLFREHLRDTVGIPGRFLNEVYRFSYRAVEAATLPIPGSVQKKIRSWAMVSHQLCYMCGQSLDFNQNDPIRGYTLDHIWPRSYGGDSIEENFLPACQSCNTGKKSNFATWAMPAVQSLLYGIAPEEQRLEEIQGSFKFSMHYRAAQQLAIQKRWALKDAFLEIGPWTSTRLIDADDVSDFFNLENHKPY